MEISPPDGQGLYLLSESIRWLVTIGLVLAAVEYMTGWCPFPGMAPLEDALATVSSIGIVLLGSLPMAELVRRLLVRPFAWLGERLGLKPQSLTGMLVGLVSALPTLSLYQDMEPPGGRWRQGRSLSAAPACWQPTWPSRSAWSPPCWRL